MNLSRQTPRGSETHVWLSDDLRVVLTRYRRHNIRATIDGVPFEGGWPTLADAERAVGDYFYAMLRREAFAHVVGRTISAVEDDEVEVEGEPDGRVLIHFSDGAVLSLRSEGGYCASDWGDFYLGSSINVEFEDGA